MRKVGHFSVLFIKTHTATILCTGLCCLLTSYSRWPIMHVAAELCCYCWQLSASLQRWPVARERAEHLSLTFPCILTSSPSIKHREMRWRQQHVVRKVEVWVGVKSVRESMCMHVCVCVSCWSEMFTLLESKVNSVAFRSRLIFSADEFCTVKCSLQCAPVSAPSRLHK